MTLRRGLTLAEILIVIVILGVVGVGITRMLTSQLRYFGQTSNARDARAVSRNAINLVRNEMRMIEPNGIAFANADSIRVRLPYAVGLHCSASTVTFVPVDSLTWATARYAGYAWKDTSVNAAYTWVASADTTTIGAAAACTGVNFTPIPGGQIRTLIPAVALMPTGAPVMLYQTVTYYFGNSVLVPGRTALWRRVVGGANEEVAVPLNPDSYIRFYPVGSTTAQDAVPSPVTNIRGVELVLRGESERTSPGTGAPAEAETRLSIFFRNVVQ